MHRILAGQSGNENRRLERVLAAGIRPVFQKQVLQPANGRAFHAQVCIPVSRLRKQALVFFIGDIGSAGKSHPSIANHNLAVGTQIQHGPQEQTETNGVESGQLTTSRHETFPQLPPGTAHEAG